MLGGQLFLTLKDIFYALGGAGRLGNNDTISVFLAEMQLLAQTLPVNKETNL